MKYLLGLVLIHYGFRKMNRKILMFEDDPLYSLAMATMLKNGGYRVERYNKPELAMRAIHQGSSYDLLLTDLSSTDSAANGTDIAETSKSVNPTIPVFTMSSYSTFSHPKVDLHLDKAKPIPELVKIIKSQFKYR